MLNFGESLRKFADRFRKDTNGSVTIEYVMWVPIMAAGIGLSMDASMLMHKQANLFVLARDSARIVALGRGTDEEVEASMTARLGSAYTVDVNTVGSFVTSTVSIKFKDIMMFGGQFTGTNTLSGQVSMFIEAEDGSGDDMAMTN